MAKPKALVLSGAFVGGVNALMSRCGFDIARDIEKADLVVFTGGEDVCPTLYGDKAHPFTYCSPRRCEWEKEVYEECRALDIPMAGICRGAQILNVLNGGRMYQHVDKHGGDHKMYCHDTGETITVSSIHHQMCMLTEKAIILSTSQQHGQREWFDKGEFKSDTSAKDIEGFLYTDTKCFGFQPHPELNSREDDKYAPMASYFNRCIHKYLLGE